MDTLVAAILQYQPVQKVLKSQAIPLADIAARDQAGLTPLHHAVLAGNTDAVDALLSHASRNTRPLRRASGGPSRAAGSPWDLVTAPGPAPARSSPLHMAAERNDDLLRHMLGHSSLVNVGASFLGIPISSKPQPELLELRDDRGWSLLHYAVSRANTATLRQLVQHLGGGDRAAGGGSNYSSGSSSAGGGATGEAEVVQGNGAAGPFRWSAAPNSGINAADANGCTPLHIAAKLGHADCCRLLLKAGADQSKATTPPDSAMPIHLAASGNHTAVVETLFRHAAAQHGFRTAQAMLLRPNGRGETALHVAALHGAVDAARRLLHLVFPFDTRGPLGRTAFHLAALRGNVPTLQMLIRHSTPLQRELCDVEGFTAAHLAAAAGQLDALRVLAGGGCSMDARAAAAPAAPAGCEGWTPLHCAARAGDVAAIELLVCELGADPHARDASGRTPCDLAVAVACSHPGDDGSVDGGSGVQNLDDGSLDAAAVEDDGAVSTGCTHLDSGGAAATAGAATAAPPVKGVNVATAGGVAVGFLRGPSIGQGPDGGVGSGGAPRLNEAQALAVLQTFIRLLHKPARMSGAAHHAEPVSPAPSAVVSPAASEAVALGGQRAFTVQSHGGAESAGPGVLPCGGSSGPPVVDRAAAGRAAEPPAGGAERLVAGAGADDAAVECPAKAKQQSGPPAKGAAACKPEALAEESAVPSAANGQANPPHLPPLAGGLGNGVHAAALPAMGPERQAVARLAGTAPRASPFAVAARKPVHTPLDSAAPHDGGAQANGGLHTNGLATAAAAAAGEAGAAALDPGDTLEPALCNPAAVEAPSLALAFAAQMLAPPAATPTRASPFGAATPTLQAPRPVGLAAITAVGATAAVQADAPGPVAAPVRPSPFVATTRPSPFTAVATRPSPFAAASRPSPFMQAAAKPPLGPGQQPESPAAALPNDGQPNRPTVEAAIAAVTTASAAAAAAAEVAEEGAGPTAVPAAFVHVEARTAPIDIPTAVAEMKGSKPEATPFATATAIAAGVAGPGSLLGPGPSPAGSAVGGALVPSSDAAASSYILSAINSPFGFSALNRAILLQRHALVEALLMTLPDAGAGGAGNALTMPGPNPATGFGRSGAARKPSLPAQQPSGTGKSSSQGKPAQLSPAASASGYSTGEPAARTAALHRQGTPAQPAAPSRLKRPASHPRELQQLPHQPQPPQHQRSAVPPMPQPQRHTLGEPPQQPPNGDAAAGSAGSPGGAAPAGPLGQGPDADSSLPPLLPLGNLNGSLTSAGVAVLEHPSAPVPGVLSWEEPTGTFRTHHANHVSRVWLHWPGTPDPATGWLLAEMVVVDAGSAGGHVWLGLGPVPDAIPPYSTSTSASTSSLAAAAGAANGPSPAAALPGRAPAALLSGVGPLPPTGATAAVAAAKCPVMNHPHTHVICVRDGQAFRGGVLTLDLGGAVRMEARAGDVVGLFWNRLGRAVAFTLNGKYCGRLAGLPAEELLTPVVGLQCGACSFRWRCVSNGVIAGGGIPGSGGSGRVAGNIDGLMIREQMLNEDPETPWLCKEPSMTSLHFAAWAGNTRVLPRLVRAKAFAPDELDADGWTPVHFAALAGQLEVVQGLIGLGCQPDVKSKCGQTPALLAAKYGRSPDHVVIMRLLADMGAALDIRDPRGRTLLMLAARAGNLAMVQLLLERGLDASATDNQDREAVQFAGQHGAIFRLLRNAQDAQRAGARKARARRRQQELQEQDADTAATDPPPLPVPTAIAEPPNGAAAIAAASGGRGATASSVGSELTAGDGSAVQEEGGSEGDARGRDVDVRQLPLLAERWRVGAGQLVRGRLIEQGAFGAVFEGTWCSARVAIKQVLRRRRGSAGGADGAGEADREAEREVASLRREVAILAALPPHERIARMLGSVELPGEGTCLVMAYYPHTLQGVMQSERLRRSWLTPARRATIARQLAEGLAFLHGLPGPRIIHRDLKPNNVLLEAPPSLGVKICDFGLARLLTSDDVQSSSAAGHAFWMAPELLRALSYDEKVDVYSYGVILYQLAYWVDDQLYGGLNKAQVDFQVVHGILRLQDRLPGGIDPGVQALVRDCLDENPRARPSMAQVLERLGAVRELSQPQHGAPPPARPPTTGGAEHQAAGAAAAALGPDSVHGAHAVGRQTQSPQHQGASVVAAGRPPEAAAV